MKLKSIMEKALCSVVLVLGVFVSDSCFGASQALTVYLYKGFDTNGILIVEGSLSLTVSASNRVEGKWNLNEAKASQGKKIGPQLSTGMLAGQINGSKVNLNLNPGWVDNNVILVGEVTGTNMHGHWGYYGFAGKIADGTFEATRKQRAQQR